MTALWYVTLGHVISLIGALAFSALVTTIAVIFLTKELHARATSEGSYRRGDFTVSGLFTVIGSLLTSGLLIASSVLLPYLIGYLITQDASVLP